MSTQRFVEIYRAESTVDAHLVKAALEADEIAAHIAEGSVSAVYPNLWWSAPRILVAEIDAPKATEILRKLEAARATPPTSQDATQE